MAVVSVNTTEILAIFTVVVILLLQYGLSAIRRLTERHRHLEQMIEHTYAELAVVGIVAFLLFVIDMTTDGISPTQRHSFETVHMTLFLVAIVHAIVVVTLVFLSMRISKRWERIEAHDFRHWREAKEEKFALSARIASRPCLLRVFCGAADALQYSLLLELVRFHELKWRFLRNNHLPPHFHFTAYLRKAKQHIFRDLGSLPAGLWAALAAILLVDLLVRSNSPVYSEGVSLVVAVPLACGVVLLGCVALFIKVRAVYWAIMHSQVVEIDADVARDASSWRMVDRKLSSIKAAGAGHSAESGASRSDALGDSATPMRSRSSDGDAHRDGDVDGDVDITDPQWHDRHHEAGRIAPGRPAEAEGAAAIGHRPSGRRMSESAAAPARRRERGPGGADAPAGALTGVRPAGVATGSPDRVATPAATASVPAAVAAGAPLPPHPPATDAGTGASADADSPTRRSNHPPRPGPGQGGGVPPAAARTRPAAVGTTIQPGPRHAPANATMPALISAAGPLTRAITVPAAPHDAGSGGTSVRRRATTHRRPETLVGGRIRAPRVRSFVGDSDGGSVGTRGGGGAGGYAGSARHSGRGTIRPPRRGLAWSVTLTELGPREEAGRQAALAAVAANRASSAHSAGRTSDSGATAVTAAVATSPTNTTVVTSAAGGLGTPAPPAAITHTVSQHQPPPVAEATCCAGRHRAGERFHQRDLFWFRNPTLIVRLMRGLVFVASVLLALVIQFGPVYASEGASAAELTAVGVAIALMLLGLAVLLERVVPLYVLTTHIGELVDERLLLQALRKSDDRHAIRVARKIARAERRRRRMQARAIAAASHASTAGDDDDTASKTTRGAASVSAAQWHDAGSARGDAAAPERGGPSSAPGVSEGFPAAHFRDSSAPDPSGLESSRHGRSVPPTVASSSRGGALHRTDDDAPPSQPQSPTAAGQPAPATAAPSLAGPVLHKQVALLRGTAPAARAAPSADGRSPPGSPVASATVVSESAASQPPGLGAGAESASLGLGLALPPAHRSGEHRTHGSAPVAAVGVGIPAHSLSVGHGVGDAGSAVAEGGRRRLLAPPPVRAPAGHTHGLQPPRGFEDDDGRPSHRHSTINVPRSSSLVGYGTVAGTPAGSERGHHGGGDGASGAGGLSLAVEAALGGSVSRSATPLPIEGAFWGSAGGSGWRPDQARAVLTGGNPALPGSPIAASPVSGPDPARDLSRDEWAALLAGLPEDQALKLPRRAREALLAAFSDDVSLSDSEEEELELEQQQVQQQRQQEQEEEEEARLGTAQGRPCGGCKSLRRCWWSARDRWSAAGDWCSSEALPAVFGEDANDTDSDDDDQDDGDDDEEDCGGRCEGGADGSGAGAGRIGAEELSAELQAEPAAAGSGGWATGMQSAKAVIGGPSHSASERHNPGRGGASPFIKVQAAPARIALKRYRPGGCAGFVARLGDLLSRSRLWRAGVFIVIAVGAASAVLQTEVHVISEVGSGAVGVGSIMSLVCGSLMLLELLIRCAGSAAYICTGRCAVLVSPTPSEMAAIHALALERDFEDIAMAEYGGRIASEHGSAGSSSSPSKRASACCGCWCFGACVDTDTAVRVAWRSADVALLAVSAVLLLLVGIQVPSLQAEWAALVTARLLFIVPWRQILVGDPYSRAAGAEGSSIASVLASRGEFTFYTEDRDYRHGMSSAQLQVAAIASRLQASGSVAPTSARGDEPGVAPFREEFAQPPTTRGVIERPQAEFGGSTTSLTAARGKRWAHAHGNVRNDQPLAVALEGDNEGDDTMTAALAEELQVIRARRMKSGSVLFMDPSELAAGVNVSALEAIGAASLARHLAAADDDAGHHTDSTDDTLRVDTDSGSDSD
ncbi:hypothetical protein FNF31_00906 [Cafeteria roenbergensis]|uniref:Uncharacterized protein n=1 Tax=Cafeteria roenbergensis TaxID=33653 RepID=A0A5A8DS48_CAFRO|nr:hypothetical protein FNF31_00906 [Cafeteria roenbergensis]